MWRIFGYQSLPINVLHETCGTPVLYAGARVTMYLDLQLGKAHHELAMASVRPFETRIAAEYSD